MPSARSKRTWTWGPFWLAAGRSSRSPHRKRRRAYRIAELRYKEGESDLLDMLTVQQRVFTADTNLLSVDRLLLEQRVNLHLALGGSWVGD